MEGLDRDLAARIVERSMAATGLNVNVMDADGRILASGDAQRVGSVHEGAVLAVTQRREVVVDTETAAGLVGARPGVNLPLWRRDEIVGAVGITGSPDEVGVLAGLIRGMAELMVEQAETLQSSLWRGREREQLLARVLGADLDDDEVAGLGRWAEHLGLDLGRTWVVALITPAVPGGPADEASGGPPRLRADPAVPAVLPSADGLVALVDADRAPGPAEVLAARLPADDVRPRHVVVGLPGAGPHGIARSHATARDLLALARAEPSGGPVRWSVTDRATETLLMGLRSQWQTAELALPWRRLVEADRHGDLQRTFRTYCDHLGDLAACAAALHVHRNTLRYRLRRIEEHSGLRLDRAADLTRLYLGSVVTG